MKEKIANSLKLDLNTEFGNSILQIFQNVIENANVKDSIKQIILNIEKINNKYENFRIESDLYDVNSSFIASVNDPRIILKSQDVNPSIILHEFGHALIHLFGKNVDSELKLKLDQNVINAINSGKENVNQNLDLLNTMIDEWNLKYQNALIDTAKWYNQIREQEHVKVKEELNRIYDAKDIESLKELFFKATNSMYAKNAVLKIINDSNLIVSQVSEIINNQELMLSIAIKYYDVEKQYENVAKTVSDFSYTGDSKKIFCMVSSVIENLKIETEDNKVIQLPYGHSKEYYSLDNAKAFDELFADFFCLQANGRSEALETFKELVGDTLYETLNKEMEKIISNINEEQLLDNSQYKILLENVKSELEETKQNLLNDNVEESMDNHI